MLLLINRAQPILCNVQKAMARRWREHLTCKIFLSATIDILLVLSGLDSTFFSVVKKVNLL